MLLVASALASMRWLLCGEKMRVQKKTISVIAHKLHPVRIFPFRFLLNQKSSPASNYEYYGFYELKNKRSVSVIISGQMVSLSCLSTYAMVQLIRSNCTSPMPWSSALIKAPGCYVSVLRTRTTSANTPGNSKLPPPFRVDTPFLASLNL